MSPRLDMLRDTLMPLPGVDEDVKWETNYCFTVGGRIFCIYDLEPETEGSVTIPTESDELPELLETPGIRRAPYLGRAGWITIAPRTFSDEALIERIKLARERVSKKLTKAKRRELGIE